MSDTVMTFSPTLTLPINFTLASGQSVPAEAYKLWACIPVNDETGIVIDNVQKGDTVLIYDGSGIASFKSTNMAFVKSAVGIANAVVNGVAVIATEGAAAPFLAGWNSVVDSVQGAIPSGAVNHGRRDMYGRDPGTGDYGKNEGGLIVCMPESKGAIYATSDYYLASGSKSGGRQIKYYSAATNAKNAFFPCNVNGGTMQGTATTAGAVHILAFDSKFTDNAGYYTVAIMVLRGTSGKTQQQLISELASSPPSSGV